MIRIFAVSILAALGVFGAAGNASAEADTPLTVVELFTSQGCSSCPPADAFLGELAGRDDVIAVAFHITYWDYIGWKDPFATDWATERQYSYAKVLGRGYPYTPQMVMDGKHDIVGSDRVKVANALVASMGEAGDRIPMALRREAGDVVVTLPERRLDAPLQLWLVRYSGAHETKVARGENRGETLVNTNIAQHLELLGSWPGKAAEFRTALPLPGEKGGVAVWLQQPG
ncbi:MAG: DUF1223 domain-containing protein, partial [Alphaproteobacteria bacterium]|nr:DUF1223 domain-containing protein [Alphaproteobacteria bacterium]